MMKKELVMVFALLFAVQFAFAFETNIEINTLPNHSMSISFLNPESTGIGDLNLNTTTISNTGDGLVNLKFVNDAPVFHLQVFVMKGSSQVINEKFENLNAGDDITLILFPGFPKESMLELASEVIEETSASSETSVSNESLTNETEEVLTENSTAQITGNIVDEETINKTENSTKSGFFNKVLSMIGFAVEDKEDVEVEEIEESEQEGNSYSKFIFYFIGAFILLGILFFVGGRLKKNLMGHRREDKGGVEKSDDDDEKPYVNDARTKMAEAETEMKIADEVQKLKDLKERLDKDKYTLEKIRDSKR